MVFQLSILLYIYFGLLAVWLAFFLVAIYHMLKFGFKNFSTLLVTVIFSLVAAFMLYLSFWYIQDINWQAELILFGEFGSGAGPFFK